MGRSANPILLTTGALWMGAVLTSCAMPETDPASMPASPPGASSTTTPTPGTAAPTSETGGSATGSPTTAPASSAPPATLITYTTSDNRLSFDHPADWTVTEEPESAPPGGVSVVVHDAAGRQAATLQTNLVTGAVCAEKVPYAVYDSEPLPALAQESGTPAFRFESRTDPAEADPVEMLTFAYGITSASGPEGPEACPIAHFFTWPPSGAAFGGIYDPFDASPGRPMHIDNPQAYTETEEYKQIKAMITSLRPPG